MSEEPQDGASGRLGELRTSARGWHGVQLAVLGFIGLCGVLKGGDSTAPGWIEALAGLLTLAAFAMACLGTYLVARAAWPLYGPEPTPPGGDRLAIAEASRSLRSGLVLTFVAVALLALGATSAWWPADGDDEAAAVEVQAGGRSWCGRLAAAGPGVLGVVTTDGAVALRLETVEGIAPATTCE